MDHSSPVSRIAGLDEAGRGALAGPVVAGAVILPFELTRRRRAMPCWSPHRKKPAGIDCLIADSKMLSPVDRDIAFQWISQWCAWGVGVVGNEYIDEFGIVRATEHAMRLAIEHLARAATPERLLVDGRDAFRFEYPHESVVRGDSTHACIAAASIVAKVTRDRIMREWHASYPQYLFDGHKGYGSPEHRARILTHGPCPLHRRSFLSSILMQQLSLLQA